MSLGKTNETNISSSLILDKNKNSNINTNHREQIIKKNKIINIRIYQNYSSNKNSNTFYNPCTNNYINNVTVPLKITNDMGTQTITEKEIKKIVKKKNDAKNSNNKAHGFSPNNKKIKDLQTSGINYNFTKTFSPTLMKRKLVKNDNKTINVKRKSNNNMRKNYSYNMNKNITTIINLKNIINNQSKKDEFNRKNNNQNIQANNKTNIIENSAYVKKEQNNNSDEKNKVAKKYSLFNLKNDNKYLIINDGHYDSHYHENSKLSINNIYAKIDKKFDNEENKSPVIPSENKYIYYLHSENNECNINNFSTKLINYNFSDVNSPYKVENSKNNVNKKTNNYYIKRKNNFENLSIIKCNNIIINEEKKKFENINYEENKNNLNYEIKNNECYYNNVNNFFKEYRTNRNNKQEYIINDNINTKNIRQKNIINEITKDSFQIISKQIPVYIFQKFNRIPIADKEESKINKKDDETKKKKEKNVIKNLVQNQKDKKYEILKKKEINTKIIEDNKLNKKYESFLHNEIIQEDENGIKFEDLLKTYTDESIKGNQSIEEINNKIIGDEKTFFNTSKIPKVQECNYIKESQKENDMNIYNKINKENVMNHNRNKYEKINVKANYNRISSNKIVSKKERKILNILNNKKNVNDNFEQVGKLMKSNTCKNTHKHYIFNIDNIYKKNLNKEKMYNYLFNEKDNQSDYNNKELLKKDNNNDINFFDTIINKLNKDIKSCTSNQFYRKNNTTRIEFLNSNKRNKSFKDSYSKYYLNKLEMENKFLIPQLSKKTDDFFNINFFNRNQF